MKWLICSNKQGRPYAFEAASIKGSIRNALSDLLSLKQLVAAEEEESGAEQLRSRHTNHLFPGLYLILKDDGESFPQLVGFWVVFGHHYLEDGPQGAPDKDPPYAQEILEALTEEVWWENYLVYPREGKVWHPLIVLNWPSDLSSRSRLAPPGLALPSSEFAKGSEVDLEPQSWLERYETEPLIEEVSEEVRPVPEDEWSDLPPKRSLLLVIKAKLRKSSLYHEGWFNMVHPQFLGDETDKTVLGFPEWLEKAIEQQEYEESDREGHFLGQPMELPDKNVAFPASGWLTRRLEIWPLYPKEIRHAILMPRDVGSRAWAQFKQASGIAMIVLTGIVCLSLIVRIATEPRIKSLPERPPPDPQPALSLCSPDYERFIEEFRCQITHFATETEKDQAVCGDPNSKTMSLALSMDKRNLQAAYCGIRDRIDDGWVYKKDPIAVDYGTIALTKACFNVLGWPYEYSIDFAVADRAGQSVKQKVPVPSRFFGGNLSVQQLINIRTELNLACDEMKFRMENRVEGSIFASLVGDVRPKALSPKRSQEEGFALREFLATSAKNDIADKTGKICFERGMLSSPYSIERYKYICAAKIGDSDAYSNKKDFDFPIWQKLNRDEEGTACSPIRSVNNPGRDLNSCSVVAQYERARFGAYPEQDVKDRSKEPNLTVPASSPSSLWRCHNKLGYRDSLRTKDVKTLWDLSLPIPNNYNISGAGVQRQIQLDAGLRAMELNPGIRKNLGSCWDVVAKRLNKYTPVHPLLADLDDGTWPTMEQQLCGQVCATYYHFQKPEGGKIANWITRENDLRECIHDGPPAGAKKSRGRLDRLILPWNYDLRDEWVVAKDEHVCAFNLIAQGFFPEGYLVGDLLTPAFAGSTTDTDKIAGGESGAAYKAVQSLSRYGQTRSRASCAYAASQCFANLITESMKGDPKENEADTTKWKSNFQNLVLSLSRLSIQDVDKKLEPNLSDEGLAVVKGDVRNPWCRLVHPYLDLDGLPEGQLDLPCAMGVDDAQQNAEKALDTLVKRYGAN